KIGRNIKLALQASEILTVARIELPIMRHRVSAMLQLTGSTGDIPATPPFIQRRPVIGNFLSATGSGCPVGTRVRRTDQETRYIQRPGAHVTLQTRHVTAHKSRLLALMDVQGIKLLSLLGV